MKKIDLLGIGIIIVTLGSLFAILLISVFNLANVEQTETIIAEVYQNSPNNEADIEQMVDDFELVIELQQYYYQENITSHSFGDWLQINYPELYKRIESYF